MTRLSVSELRTDLSTTLSKVAFAKKRVVLQRQGKDLVAVVPLEDLALLEQLEDRLLAEEAERVLTDPEEEWIPWEQVKAELGL